MQARYYQPSPRALLRVILCDLDHHHGPIWHDAPPPSYAVSNTRTGHQHAGYLLAVPVARGQAAHAEPQRLAEDITRALCRELHADTGYTGLLSRGPAHPDHETQVITGRAWTLTELLNSLPPMPDQRRRSVTHAGDLVLEEGRNVEAFHALRLVAYRAANAGRQGDELRRRVQVAADQFNREQLREHPAGPLSVRELAGIVRSICRYIDAKYTPTSGGVRSRTHSRDRQPLTPDEAHALRQAGQAQGAATRRQGTRAEIVAAVASLQAQGRSVTASELLKITNLSRKAIYAHSDAWQA